VTNEKIGSKVPKYWSVNWFSNNLQVVNSVYCQKHSDEIHHTSKKNAILLSKVSGFNVKTSFSFLNNQICHHRSFLFMIFFHSFLPPRFFFLRVFYGTKRNSYCIWKEDWPEISYPCIHTSSFQFIFWLTKEIFFIEMQPKKKKKFLGMKFIMIILNNKILNINFSVLFWRDPISCFFCAFVRLPCTLFCMYNFIMLDFLDVFVGILSENLRKKYEILIQILHNF